MGKRDVVEQKNERYYKPLVFLEENKVLAYHAMEIYVLDLKEGNKKKIATFDSTIFNRLISRYRLIVRMLRLEPRSCIEIDAENYLLAFHKKLWKINIKEGNITEVYRFRTGMNHCQSFCTNGENIYFGDYMSNPDKHTINLYKFSKKDLSVDIIYTFPEGEVNHVHQIIWDEYRSRYWIFTGDEGDASAIWYTENEFKSINLYLKGSQQYRACVVFVTPENLIYATDTPYEQNYIIKVNIDTKKCMKCKEINGPGIYGTSDDEFFYWATSVEPEISNGSVIRSLFSYHMAQGINLREVHLVCMSKSNEKIDVIAKYKKDKMPIALFQFGEILFADNRRYKKQCIGYGQSLKKYDGCIMKIVRRTI